MELLKVFCGAFLVVWNFSDSRAQTIVETQQNSIPKIGAKPRTLYDYQTRVVAFKDLIDSKCLLEILTNDESIISQRVANYGSSLKPLPTTSQLSKREIWRLAGTRISDFCRGFPTYLIQIPQLHGQNDLPLVRRKRNERHYFVGKIRGQTQSQYLNFGFNGAQPGKAEAESSDEGTKAVVTGTNGMGQAQSQSSPVDCSQCFGPGYQDQALLYGYGPGPAKLTGPGYPAGSVRPGHRYPGGASGDGNYPERTGGPQGGDFERPGESGGYPGHPGEEGYPRPGGQSPSELSGSPTHLGEGGTYPAGPGGGNYPGPRGQLPSELTGGRKRPGGDVNAWSPGGVYPTGPRRPGEGGNLGTGVQPAALSAGEHQPGEHTGSTWDQNRLGSPNYSGLQQSGSSRKPWGSGPSGVVGPNYKRPGDQLGGGGNSWEGGSGGQVKQSGKFYGTFEGTYETDVTGEEGYSGGGQNTAGGITSGAQGPPGSTTYPVAATQQGGTGASGGQYINGQWVPSGAGGTQWQPSARGPGASQWADGRRVPSSATTGTSGPGQWVDGRWVPSGDTLVPAGQSQWAPRGGSPGQWPTGSGAGGQLVDGKWPSAGGGAGEGQWVFPGAGGASGSPGGNGQWVDGRWVPAAGAGGRSPNAGQWGPAGETGGEKRVPPGSAGTGTSPGTGQWVPSTKPPGGQGAGQWTPPGVAGPGGTSVAQGAEPGAGQWINGHFLQVPAGGSGPSGGPTGASGPGQWIPGGPGSIPISPYRPEYQYGPGGVSAGQGGGPGAGSQGSGSGGVGGQGGGPGGVVGQIGGLGGVGGQIGGPGEVSGQGAGLGGVGGQGSGSGGVAGQGGGPGGVGGQGSGPTGVAGQGGGPGGVGGQGGGAGGTTGQGGGPGGIGGQTGGPGGVVGQSGGPAGVHQSSGQRGVGGQPGGVAGGQGPGQWINGQWVSTGGLGPGAASQGGPSGAPGQWSYGGSSVPYGPGYQSGAGGQGPGQWVNGQWVPSRAEGASQGPFPGGQWSTGGSTPSYRPGYQVAPGGYPSEYGNYPGGGYYPGSQAGAPGGGYAPGGQVPPGQYVQGGGAGQSGQWNYGSPASGQWTNGTWAPTGADDSDSQVLTSVQQSGNESIIAKAQAQGKYQGATAQSQVSGAYSGTGSFSASAGSDDGKRGALTQVSGGKDGAQSSAQGRGGVGQSQAQVTLDADTGDALSSAQTSGNQQGTQTQVRASEKGGLADAQANGVGPTSSQAQIGFTPYDDRETIDNQTSPFKGGGTAAAQSGTNTGMTQTQIQGKFRYGIKYQGAAQAGSGSTAIRNLTEPTGYFKPLNFTANKVNFTRKTQSQQTAVAAPTKRADSLPEAHNSAETTTEKLIKDRNKLFEMQVHKVDPKSQEDPVVVSSLNETETSEDPDYVVEDYGEDEDISEEAPEPIVASGKPLQRNLESPAAVNIEQPEKKVVSQSSDYQKQHIVLDPLEDLDATVHQSEGNAPVDGMVLQPGQVIPGSTGYKIPAGFRGRVTSISNGPNTYAIGQNAQAQSVTLSPGNGKIYYNKPSNPIYGVVTKTTYKDGHYGTGYSYQPIYHPVGYRVKSGTVLPNFVSISKSETGSENLGTGRRTPNVYYTQSSSCGMFTNSCVYTNGRKTCFPVRKMNSDGSPVTC